MKVNIKWSGDKEAVAALKAVTTKTKAQIIRATVRKAVTKDLIKPLRGAVNYRASTEKRIKIVNDRKDQLTIFAGPTLSIFWTRWTELGTKLRKTKTGKSLGRIVPRNVMPRIIIRSVKPITKTFTKDFGQIISKILRAKLKRINKI